MEILDVKFKWENGLSFEMTETFGEETKSIIKVHENGDIAAIWPQITKVCTAYITQRMGVIGDTMKQP